MVTVAVDAGRGENLGQPIQQLESREPEGGTARGIGLRKQIEDLVGATVDKVESIESERRPGAIPDEPFEASSVGGLDADAGVEAKPAAVIPGQHVFGLVGLEESVAAVMPQDPGADRVLEALQELGGEGRGFVETEAGGGIGWVLMGVTLRPLEAPV